MGDSFKAEWDALVANARTRVNSVPAEDGGAGPGSADRLTTDSAAKRAAAGYLEETLLPDTRAAGKLGGEGGGGSQPGMLGSERAQPGGTMQTWDAWQGVEHVLGEWAKHVRNLENRLQGERDALRGARVLYQTQDGLVHGMFSDPLQLPALPGNQPTGLRPAG
ncbi:hypothetical protein [Streptomyces boninensis]|uniref:hypothetical protein n=1 Tax=Streptomyces boninensis TaxID=2039455 RepID=UPI003B223DD3